MYTNNWSWQAGWAVAKCNLSTLTSVKMPLFTEVLKKNIVWPQYALVAQWYINRAFGWTHQSRVNSGIQVATFMGSCPSTQERKSWITFLEQNKSAGEERLSFIPGTLHWCANIKIISNKLRPGFWVPYIATTYHAQMYDTSFHLANFSSDLYAFLLFVPCQACSGEQSDGFPATWLPHPIFSKQWCLPVTGYRCLTAKN